jgi:hypothetical protein
MSRRRVTKKAPDGQRTISRVSANGFRGMGARTASADGIPSHGVGAGPPPDRASAGGGA